MVKKKLIPKHLQPWQPLVLQNDNTRIQRPVIILPIKRDLIAEALRKHAAEAVSLDNRTSTLRRVDYKEADYKHLLHQKVKDDLKRAEGFQNLIALTSPSTYVEAATGEQLTPAGKLATDIIAFGFPGMIKKGTTSLIKLAPKIGLVRGISGVQLNRSDLGKYLADGSEQTVYDMGNTVQKVYDNGSVFHTLEELENFVNSYLKRNEVPMQVPVTYIGYLKEPRPGLPNELVYFPVFSQKKVQPVTESWETLEKKVYSLLRKNGYTDVEEPGVFINAKHKLIDILPDNIGLDNGNLVFTDVGVEPHTGKLLNITPEQWTAAQDAAIARGDMVEAQTLRDLHFKVSAPNSLAIGKDGFPLDLFHGTRTAEGLKKNGFSAEMSGKGNRGADEGNIYLSNNYENAEYTGVKAHEVEPIIDKVSSVYDLFNSKTIPSPKQIYSQINNLSEQSLEINKQLHKLPTGTVWDRISTSLGLKNSPSNKAKKLQSIIDSNDKEIEELNRRVRIVSFLDDGLSFIGGNRDRTVVNTLNFIKEPINPTSPYRQIAANRVINAMYGTTDQIYSPEVLRLYGNFESPLLSDFKMSPTDINPLEIGRKWTPIRNDYNNREKALLQELAKPQYDSSISKNKFDVLFGDVYIAKKPNNLKLADAVTYDDNGVRIPLGERDNFKLNDIRYFSQQPIVRTVKEHTVTGNPLQIRLSRLQDHTNYGTGVANQAILVKPTLHGNEIRNIAKQLEPNLTEDLLDLISLIVYANRRGAHLPIESRHNVSGISAVDILEAINYLKLLGIKNPNPYDVGIIAGHEVGHGVLVSPNAKQLVSDFVEPEEFYTRAGQVLDDAGVFETSLNPVSFGKFMQFIDNYLKRGNLDNGISALKLYMLNISSPIKRLLIMGAINRFSVGVSPVVLAKNSE